MRKKRAQACRSCVCLKLDERGGLCVSDDPRSRKQDLRPIRPRTEAERMDGLKDD